VLVFEQPNQKIPAAPPETVSLNTQQTSIPSQTQETGGITFNPKFFDEVKNVLPGNSPFLGVEDAKVTIVEFSEYQCPYCKNYFDNAFAEIKNEYVNSGKVKYYVRNFPLEEHPQAIGAASAAICAREQGKFWSMHDALFLNQDSWSFSESAPEFFKSIADKLKLDKDKFDKCLSAKETQDEIAKDISDGKSYGVLRTPTFFINGIKVIGAQKFSTFKIVIDQALSKSK
jgi:protein-disulfide isomerase